MADVITELFNAIYARYGATPLSGKIDELYNTEATEEATFPYGTVSLPSNVPVWTFNSNFEDVLIQFKLVSEADTTVEVIEAFTALKAAFDFFDLVIAGHETISLVRESSNLLRAESRWVYDITYRILIKE